MIKFEIGLSLIPIPEIDYLRKSFLVAHDAINAPLKGFFDMIFVVEKLIRLHVFIIKIEHPLEPFEPFHSSIKRVERSSNLENERIFWLQTIRRGLHPDSMLIHCIHKAVKFRLKASCLCFNVWPMDD